MKAQLRTRLVLLLAGISFSLGLTAHPENSPLMFIAHKTRDGRIIYTNIPLRCFEDGVLICPGYHPVLDTRLHPPESATAGPSRPAIRPTN